MSNFGKLGSNMVANAINSASAFRQNEVYDNSAEQRANAEEGAALQREMRSTAVEDAGGVREYSKQIAKEEKLKRENQEQMFKLKLETERAKAAKYSAQAAKASMKAVATTGHSGAEVEIPTIDARTGQPGKAKISANMKSLAESMGGEFVANNGEVAMKAPWGAGYKPIRMADMNTTQREEAKQMLARWDADESYVKTEAPNGSTIYTHKDTGFSVNSDGFMLTANAQGKYEVASMFDLGMMTGQFANGKVEMDIQKAVSGQGKTSQVAMADEVPGTKPTAEEMNTAQTMLAVDQSGATPSANNQVPGSRTAQADDNIPAEAMPKDAITVGDRTFSNKEYNLPGLKEFITQKGESLIEKGLLQKGLKKGTPEYDKALQAQLPKLVSWAADKKFKLNATDSGTTASGPVNIAQEAMDAPEAGPEIKPESYNKSHWTDNKSEYNYTRKYTNDKEYSNNYGNYENQEDYYGKLRNTVKQLKAGKKSAESDKLLKRFATNYEKFYDLGIATPEELAAYDADMKNAQTKRNAMTSAAAQKMDAQSKDTQIISEAAAPLDMAVDKGTPALEAINLTPSQMRKVTRAQGSNKLNTDDRKVFTGIKNRARHVTYLQKVVSDTDLESLETTSPLKRAKGWLNRYFGDMSKQERQDMFAQQSMDELVSRTIKEISGAAASDQERAYIQSWMLGAKGYDGKTVKAIINNIQYKLYEESKEFGDTLYRGSYLGELQELSTATKDLRGVDFTEDVLGSSAGSTEVREIKRVNMHGQRR